MYLATRIATSTNCWEQTRNCRTKHLRLYLVGHTKGHYQTAYIFPAETISLQYANRSRRVGISCAIHDLDDKQTNTIVAPRRRHTT